MKRFVGILLAGVLVFGLAGSVYAAEAAEKAGGGDAALRAKFYDFSDQLIDGEIKKPTALYTDARQQVKFDRLLRLKKSFIPAMMQTSKERVFK